MKWLTEIQDRAAKDITRITTRLTEIDAERKQLIKMRDAYKALANQNGASHTTEEPAKETIKDVAKQLLVEAGRPLALKDLYKLMIDRGVAFDSNSPKQTIYAALSRNKDLFRNRADKRWELINEDGAKDYSSELTT